MRLAGGAVAVSGAIALAGPWPAAVSLRLLPLADASRAQARPRVRAAAAALVAERIGPGAVVRHPPGLPPDPGVPGWSLSLAYADGGALIGLAGGLRIGVDLVVDAAPPDWRRIAATYLGPAAGAELSAAAFPAAWAALEARAKCAGSGLREWPQDWPAMRTLAVAVPAGWAAAVALSGS